jgi:pimeloyl-ACP methyl ester carboxylesterase
MKQLTADIVGLLDALGAERCALVGHDWGASVAWAFAQLYPDRVACLVALSVPYHTRDAAPPTVSIAKFAGNHFSFFTYFQKPGVAEAELERNARDSLRRFYYALSEDAPPDLVKYLFTQKAADAGVLDGMPDPPRLPDWLSKRDLDHYATSYARSGFRGGLNYYRNADRDWRELPQLGATTVRQPTLFMGGKRDAAVVFGRFDPMIAAVPNLRKIVFLENCGHWIQQERPSEVNSEVIAFVGRETKR